LPTYRISYSPTSERDRANLTPNQRRDLDNGMTRIARDPYGCGSTPTYHKDHREVTCGSVIAVYQVSASVLTVTVVRIAA
jgi:hypothetical protein